MVNQTEHKVANGNARPRKCLLCALWTNKTRETTLGVTVSSEEEESVELEVVETEEEVVEELLVEVETVVEEEEEEEEEVEG
jgi:hypothetical protein